MSIATEASEEESFQETIRGSPALPHTLCGMLDALRTHSRFLQTEVASTVGKKEGLFGFSYVRLLPKLAGIRPLMNLKRKPKVPPGTSPYSPQVKSINQQLEGSLDVLNYQRVRLSGALVKRA